MEKRASIKSRATLSEKQLKPPPILEIYVHLFQKPVDKRNVGDKKIIKKFVESLAYFSKHTIDMLQRNSVLDKLLDSLEFIKVPAGTPVYHEGDPSDRFYVLVKGELRLFQPRSQQEIDLDIFTLKQLAKKQITEAAKSPTANHHNFRSQTIASFNPGVSQRQTLEAILSPSERKSADEAKIEEEHMSQPESPHRKHTGHPHHHTQVHRRRGIVFTGISSPSLFSGELSLNELLAQLEDQQYPDEAINKGISYSNQGLLTKLHTFKKKYMKLGVCTFKPFKDVAVGEGFGAFTMKVSGRPETAVAVSECYLLTLNQENFLHIFEEPLRDKIERIQVLKGTIGDDIEDRHIKIFEELFKTKTYNLYDVIYHQGERPDGLYLVRKGEIRLFYSENKDVESSEHKLSGHTHTNAEIARIPQNQFFGCENLLNLLHRSFTAEALTKCELMYLPKRFIVDPAFYIQKILTRITEGYKKMREWERDRVHEIKQKSSEPKKVGTETSSKGQFNLRVLNKKGIRDFYVLERIKSEPNEKPKDKKTSGSVGKIETGNINNLKSAVTSPKNGANINIRSRVSSLPMISSQVLSSNSPDDVDEVLESPLTKIPENTKQLDPTKLQPSPMPKIDLGSQPHPNKTFIKSEIGRPKSVADNNKAQNVSSTVKKGHQRMLSDGNSKNIDPEAPVSLWKYSAIENLSKLKTGISKSKPRKSLAELVDMYDGLLYANVDQQKNKQRYSVRNSFSSSVASTPKNITSHFFGSNFESMVKGSSAQTPINNAMGLPLSKHLGIPGTVHAPSSFSNAVEGSKEKVRVNNSMSNQPSPVLENIEPLKIAENMKKSVSFFGRESSNAMATFKSTSKQTNSTTAAELHPVISPKSQEFGGIINKKNSYTVSPHTGAIRISSFSQIFTNTAVTSPKVQLKEEVASIYQGLSKAVNKRLNTSSNELVFTPAIATKLTLRKSSLAEIREKTIPKPSKISVILQRSDQTHAG